MISHWQSSSLLLLVHFLTRYHCQLAISGIAWNHFQDVNRAASCAHRHARHKQTKWGLR